MPLRTASGQLTYLRVHDVGQGFGRQPNDYMDVEVVIILDSNPNLKFGFQLRNDNNRPARQGMLDLLRDAFNNGWTVTVDYNIIGPRSRQTFVLLRVWLTKGGSAPIRLPDDELATVWIPPEENPPTLPPDEPEHPGHHGGAGHPPAGPPEEPGA